MKTKYVITFLFLLTLLSCNKSNHAVAPVYEVTKYSALPVDKVNKTLIYVAYQANSPATLVVNW